MPEISDAKNFWLRMPIIEENCIENSSEDGKKWSEKLIISNYDTSMEKQKRVFENEQKKEWGGDVKEGMYAREGEKKQPRKKRKKSRRVNFFRAKNIPAHILRRVEGGRGKTN